MHLKWTDVADIAIALYEQHPDVDPQWINFMDLKQYVCRLQDFQDDPDHYARNAVHIGDGGGMSLYTLVWNPGQWTPIHDHGTWGVVGVVRGVLEERNFIRMDHNGDTDEGIDLARGGPVLLGEGTVTSFVPNPDHIHKTGVPNDREQAISLHLYGRNMNNFYTYDPATRTRTLIDVHHNES